ncbi:unnamed protein product [Linum tenue]|uniref:Uncharacterized protein n=1 Tax=Linum tenue TaxID=586396 RepID=A0AAV0RKL5_9ROSI|nr:unnamed protein product [Linum tenue]
MRQTWCLLLLNRSKALHSVFCQIPSKIKNTLEEDIDKELAKVSRASRGVPQDIMVGSLEDVLRKMESDLLAVKNKNRRFCPIYFQKAGSLEDVLRKMEVYMLKVEGIAFRFLPDPFQIKNTLEEEIDKELAKVSRASRGVLRNIMV